MSKAGVFSERSKVAGRPVVVTGGANGIGEALAQVAARRGATAIAVLDRADAGDTVGGCFICMPHDADVRIDEKCTQVGDGEYGQGIQCEEEYSAFTGHLCYLGGGACFNAGTDPSNGTSDPDPGYDEDNDPCSISSGEWCPAECFNCASSPYLGNQGSASTWHLSADSCSLAHAERSRC